MKLRFDNKDEIEYVFNTIMVGKEVVYGYKYYGP